MMTLFIFGCTVPLRAGWSVKVIQVKVLTKAVLILLDKQRYSPLSLLFDLKSDCYATSSQ